MNFFFFFFNDTATTEIYTLSLHDALPISDIPGRPGWLRRDRPRSAAPTGRALRGQLLVGGVGQTSRSARFLQAPLFAGTKRPTWTSAAGLESCPTTCVVSSLSHRLIGQLFQPQKLRALPGRIVFSAREGVRGSQ